MKLAFLLLPGLVLAVSSQGGQDEMPRVPRFTVTTVRGEGQSHNFQILEEF